MVWAVTKLKAALFVVLLLGFVATAAIIFTCRTAAGQDEKKPVAEKSEPAAKQEKDEGVKQSEAKANDFVWGKALDKPAAYAGLQVGIGISPKDKRTYEAGEVVKVTLIVRNAGETWVTHLGSSNHSSPARRSSWVASNSDWSRQKATLPLGLDCSFQTRPFPPCRESIS